MTGLALFVGDVGLDLTVRASRFPDPDEKVVADAWSENLGGVVANAALAARRAGIDVRCRFRIGDDAASAIAREQLAALDIGSTCETTCGPLCRAVIVIDAAGEKRLFLHPGISMYPTPDSVRRVDLDDVAWLHTAAYDVEAASLLVERCRQLNIAWSLDLEPATFGDDIDRLAPVLDGAALAFCNARSCAAIGASPVATLRRLGVKAVVTTSGGGGATYHGQDRPITVTPPPATIVDTTGAGDCLAGWFVAETMRGAAPAVALRRAVTAATLTCGGMGAQPSFPRREEVMADERSLADEARVG